MAKIVYQLRSYDLRDVASITSRIGASLLLDDVPVAILEGPISSGKTTAALMFACNIPSTRNVFVAAYEYSPLRLTSRMIALCHSSRQLRKDIHFPVAPIEGPEDLWAFLEGCGVGAVLILDDFDFMGITEQDLERLADAKNILILATRRNKLEKEGN